MAAGSGRPTNILKMLHFLSALGFGEQRVGSLSVGGTWALAQGRASPLPRCWPPELVPCWLVSASVKLLSSGDGQLYLDRCHRESGASSLGRSPTPALSALLLNSRGTAPPGPPWPESQARGRRELEQEPPRRAGRP